MVTQIFTGAESVKFGLHFSSQSHLSRHRVETEQYISYVKEMLAPSMIELCPVLIWFSSVHLAMGNYWLVGTLRKRGETLLNHQQLSCALPDSDEKLRDVVVNRTRVVCVWL